MITDEMVLAGAKAANPLAWERTDGKYMVSDITREETLNVVRRILTAVLAATPAVVVPKEPTPEMLLAGRMADIDCDMPGQVYRAMISAALDQPATPAVGGDELADRIEVYLDDTPHGGGHSDLAGANAWELLQEAMDKLRAPATPVVGVEALSIANELMQWHDACTQNSSGGDGQFRVECSSGSDSQARGLRGSLRRAAQYLAALPASPLRGRDVTIEAIRNVQMNNGAKIETVLSPSNIERIAAALSASPPEQPASPLRGRSDLADKLDAHAIRYANDYGYGVAVDLKDAAAALRAQPAFPLRGMEIDVQIIKDALLNDGHFGAITSNHIALTAIATKSAEKIIAALSASPPEQPKETP